MGRGVDQVHAVSRNLYLSGTLLKGFVFGFPLIDLGVVDSENSNGGGGGEVVQLLQILNSSQEEFSFDHHQLVVVEDLGRGQDSLMERHGLLGNGDILAGGDHEDEYLTLT